LARKVRGARIQATATRRQWLPSDYREERGRQWSPNNYGTKPEEGSVGPSPDWSPPVSDPLLVRERSPKNECTEESKGEEHDSGSTAPETRSLRNETTENPGGGIDDREEDRRNMKDGTRALKEMIARLATEKKWPK